MKDQRKIIRITFLSGKRNEERDKAFLRRHQKDGTDLHAFIEKEAQKGREISEEHNTTLLNIVIEGDELANNDDLTLSELQDADIKLKRHLKKLRDTVYKSVDLDPDAASFVNEFSVEEEGGQTYTINEGLNEKIHDLYISKIPSLESCITIIETRIKYLEKQDNAVAVEGTVENLYSLARIPERLIYLKYSGVYGFIESSVKEANADRVNNAAIAKIIAHMLNVKASSVEGLLGKLASPYNTNAKNNPYTTTAMEAAIKALNEDGFDTGELYEILEHKKKGKTN